MTNTLRLFSIEARRNAAIWFVPIIVAVAWWLLSSQSWTTFLWRDTNRLLQQSVVPFAGPAIAGVAAWMAGRNRRRGINDLLESTPHPDTQRQITLWAATALWGLVAYALFAVYMMGQTAFQATAGGPAFWPIVAVTVAMLAHAAWGFFAGQLLPSRFVAPLVGIGALGLQQFAAQYREVHSNGSSSSTWVNRLAAHNTASEWQTIFYLGLMVAALAAIALRNNWNVTRLSVFALSVGVAITGVVMLWGEYPRRDVVVTVENGTTHVRPTSPVRYNNFGQVIWSPDMAPTDPPELSEPACAGSPITVCTDSAYEPVLDEAVISAATLIEPLLGLSGVPLRVEREDLTFRGGPDASIDVSQFADRLVADDTTLQDGGAVNEAQIAIRSWLLERVSMDRQYGFGCNSDFWQPYGAPASFLAGLPTPETCAATDRFTSLSTAEQRAWLEGHYTDLRAGELTLEDLP